ASIWPDRGSTARLPVACPVPPGGVTLAHVPLSLYPGGRPPPDAGSRRLILDDKLSKRTGLSRHQLSVLPLPRPSAANFLTLAHHCEHHPLKCRLIAQNAIAFGGNTRMRTPPTLASTMPF